MPILRLVAEGVGPFEHIDVDFSDGKGNPHLGPHIIVGTNGTGKSTLLRTIAWGFASVPQYGFDFDRWEHLTSGRVRCCALLEMRPLPTFGWLSLYGKGTHRTRLENWAGQYVNTNGQWMERGDPPFGRDGYLWLARGSELELSGRGGLFFCAGYRPAPTLRVTPQIDMSERLALTMEGALSFDRTVDNKKLTAWLTREYSTEAIAKAQNRIKGDTRSGLRPLEQSLSEMFDIPFEITVRLPEFTPVLSTSLGEMNVEQLPDGLQSVLAWCGDFTMRRSNMRWIPEVATTRPAILLIDEIESHLHPQWQRRILPGLRKALPDVQIIVTTHSPFVASSCPGAKLHICEREGNKPATVRSEDSPFGQKLLTTISGVFGIDSRFDVVTERDLNTWYALKKRQPTLNSEEQAKLTELTAELSRRSEELKAIVAGPEQIPPQSVAALLASTSGKRRKVVK